MAYQNSAAAYNMSKIATASPAELTLMLYEGAIKFCNIAILGIEQNDYEKANTNIQKCRDIIVELKTTLDHKYPVAKEFDLIYEYLFNLLVQANMKKDIEVLEEVLEQLRELRDIWKEIMRSAKGA